MFQLTADEADLLRSQNATSKDSMDTQKGGRRYLPYAFTEQGVLMLSSVLNSKKAIEVNIHLVRLFIELREMVLSHKEIIVEIENIQKRIGVQDEHIQHLYNYLKRFVEKQKEPRKRIGFKE
jgi:phage regulator Rha-like protein